MTDEELKKVGDRYYAAKRINGEMSELHSIMRIINERGIVYAFQTSKLSHMLGDNIEEDVKAIVLRSLESRMNELKQQFNAL